MAARSKAWSYGLSLDGTAGSNTTEGIGCLSPASVACSQAEVSATVLSLVQSSPTECSLS